MKILTFLIIVLIQFKNSLAVNCPPECSCTWYMTNLKVNCSGSELTTLPDFDDLPIETLDLSDNQFIEFPKELSKIETLVGLDLSNNFIRTLEKNTFEGFTSLEYLLLSNNNITNWMDINPNTILLPAINLHTLSLAGNPITSFSSSDENFILISNSLLVLDLSNCKITKISGQYVLQGLKRLERLILNGNPLRSLSHITTDSLQLLDLSNCHLISLHPNIFMNMKNLIGVDLSRNPALTMMTKTNDFLKSSTIKRLDLSYCNLDMLELKGFPNLTMLILKGNMLREITNEMFLYNLYIENLDLSYNAIRSIDGTTFINMRQLKYLDLSFNMIVKIPRKTFEQNDLLTSLNLSRNYISRFTRIHIKSLINLNLSWCEILTIDNDALSEILNIREIDLSNNLLTKFPDNILSDTLEILDLSTCRLTSIRNTTFVGFPSLSRINLASNRFTTFKRDYFKGNPYLHEIWMGDNPWICNCDDSTFRDLYIYLTQHPTKIMDRKNLHCASPDSALGRSWENVCYQTWFPAYRPLKTNEKIWTFIMLTIIALSICLCITIGVKRCILGRKRYLNERELERNLEESRSLCRHNQIMLQQQAQLNAPDPRESNPPCYEDAVLLPPIKQSISMVELHSKRTKLKVLPEKTNENTDIVLDQHRYRSEEILSVRDRERTEKFSFKRSDRIDPYSRLGSQTLISERLPRNQMEIESFERITNFESKENSPYSRRRRIEQENGIIISPSAGSFVNFQSNQNSPYTRRHPKIKNNEILKSTSIHSFVNYDSKENSPYSKRHPIDQNKEIVHSSSANSFVNFSSNKNSPYSRRRSINGSQKFLQTASLNNFDDTNEINMVDNYYRQSDSDTESSNNFQMMTIDDINQTLEQLDSSREDIGMVIVHHEPKESQI